MGCAQPRDCTVRGGHRQTADGGGEERPRDLIVTGQERGYSIEQLVQGVPSEWIRLLSRTYTCLVHPRVRGDNAGTLSDGLPLRDLLDDLPAGAAQRVEDGLVKSLALGWNPNRAAREMADGLDLGRYRALTIARTEVLRSLRGTALQTYRGNSDIISGWVGVAAHGSRTCIVLDGKVYGLDEDPDFHVNDRCTLRPRLRHEEQPDRQTGEEWFRQRSEAVQRQMMGPLAFDAWKRGEIELADMVRIVHDDRWGDSAVVKGLSSILGTGKVRGV